MIGFTGGERSLMRSAQEGSMQDTCVILPVEETTNDYNEVIRTWSEDGIVTRCGVDIRGARETHGQNYTTETIDAVLRLPSDVIVSEKDRIRVTHRFGDLLAFPVTFEVVGSARTGPSGTQLDVRRVRI